MKENDCIFCKIINGEIPAEKVYDDDNFIGILDANPLVEGHTLIIPKKHYPLIVDVPNSLGVELLEAIKKVGLKLIKEGKGENFNLMVVGEDVPHAHIHVIPRKKGDGFKAMINLKKISEMDSK